MKTGRSISIFIKTLQNTRLTECLEGALKTYRTIQFSMNNGCCHPKIFSPHPSSRPPLTVCFSFFSGFILPFWGTKNPRADLLPLTRPLRPSLFRVNTLFGFTLTCQKLSSTFLPQAFDSFLRAASLYRFNLRSQNHFQLFFRRFFAARLAKNRTQTIWI